MKDNFIETTEKSNILCLKSIVPKNHIILINRLSQELCNNSVGVPEFELFVGLDVNKREIITSVSAKFDEKGIEVYTKTDGFNSLDRIVINGVISLFQAGNNVFTPAMCYRAMSGLEKNEKVSPQAIALVTSSIDKISRINIKIDFTQEAKSRSSKLQNTILKANILETLKIVVTAGGRDIIAYKLFEKPILYSYAQVTKQIITIPNKLLQTNKFIKNTKDVIIIREFLVRRINIMKSNKNFKNKIRFVGIFSELGLEIEIQNQALADKTKKMRIATKAILQYWKDQNFVKDFEFYKVGRTYSGVTILY